jgi:hypothetical protein
MRLCVSAMDMTRNLRLDDWLIREAFALGNHHHDENRKRTTGKSQGATQFRAAGARAAE